VDGKDLRVGVRLAANVPDPVATIFTERMGCAPSDGGMSV
jgi:hypothetical protein